MIAKKGKTISDRIGISTNLFLSEPDTLGLVRYLANDFDYVDIEIEGNMRKQTNNLTDYSMAKELRKIGDETGAKLSIHAPYINVDYLFADNKAEYRQLLLHCAEFSAEVGASMMTFHPGFRFPDPEDQVLRKRAIGEIQELAYELFSLTKQIGCELEFGLENMGNSRPFFTLTLEEAKTLLDTAPLTLTLDIAHCVSYAANQDEAIELLAEYTPLARLIHLSDMNFPKHVHLPLGHGDFDLLRAIDTIEASGFKGPYIVEEMGGGYKGEDYRQAALEFRERLKGWETSPTSVAVT